MSRKKTTGSTPENKELRIVVEKNIVGEFSHEIADRFKAAIESSPTSIALDMSAITVVDSYAVALCVGLFKECRSKGIVLSVLVSAELQRFFRLLKLDRVMEFTEKGTGL
jgi:anti-anti-sigma factor